MIQVKVKLHEGRIQELDVKGHAGYAESGEDLVCAGVSCIMYGTYNALAELVNQNDFVGLVEDQGHFNISIRQESEVAEIILKTAVIQLETIQESYSDYIRIKKVEV